MNLKYLCLFLALLIITAILGYIFKAHDNSQIVENFDNFSNHVVYESPEEIYDTFYSNIYDKLFESKTKNHFELYNIKNYTIDDNKYFKRDEVNILDLGCGTGEHLKILKEYKLKFVGIDKSMKMLQKAREKLPESILVKGDFMVKKNFKNREFTHVTCFFFTLYYSSDPEKLFNNVNFWLKPKGYFCVHVVNKEKFDPVLEKSSSLIPLYNPQKHSDSRITKTKLKFNKFNYIADWEFNDNKVIFEENFLFNDNSQHTRNIHKLYINSIDFYKKLAKKTGFELIKIIDLTPSNHDFNYIYIFQKKFGS